MTTGLRAWPTTRITQLPGGGAQGQAHAQLVAPLRGDVGGDAVDADRREQQREGRERAGHEGVPPLGAHGLRHPVVDRGHVEQGDVGVQVRELGADRRREGERVGARPDQEPRHPRVELRIRLEDVRSGPTGPRITERPEQSLCSSTKMRDPRREVEVVMPELPPARLLEFLGGIPPRGGQVRAAACWRRPPLASESAAQPLVGSP